MFHERRSTMSSFSSLTGIRDNSRSLHNASSCLSQTIGLQCFNKRHPLVGQHTTFNVCVMGAPNVGKSALITRLITGRFIGTYGTVAQTFYKIVRQSGATYRLNLREASNYASSEIQKMIAWCDALIVVYSEVDISSLR